MKQMTMIIMALTLIFTGIAHARTLGIGVVPWAGFSPAHVADEKGFWKALGTDVEVIGYENNINMKKALVHKRIDFAIDVSGIWVNLFMEGTPVTILAEIDWSFGGDKLIIKKDMNPASLKGQPLGVFSNAVIPMVHKYLTENNLTLSDVQLIEQKVEELPSNFISGRFKAVVCYDPFAIRAEKEGNGKLAATSATYPGCITDSFAARTDVLKDIPKTDVVNIFKGWIKAVDWLNDKNNQKEYFDILNKRTFEGDSPYSEAELKEILSGVRIHDAAMLTKQNRENGGMSLYLKDFKTMLKENNMLKKDFSTQDIFDNTAIMEALGKSR